MPLLSDFSHCIEEIGQEITVVRSVPTEFDGPRATRRETETTFKIVASFQPMSQRQLDRLPEGMRNKGACEVFSPVEIHTVETSENRVPDRLIVNGISYQVDLVDDWSTIAGYWRATVTKLGR